MLQPYDNVQYIEHRRMEEMAHYRINVQSSQESGVNEWTSRFQIGDC